MPSLAHLLSTKGSHVWSISPDATVFEGLRLMAEKNIGALLIVEHGRVVGIMSERDYARKVVLEGLSSLDTTVRRIMTTRVMSARPDDSVETAMALMTGGRIRHLPVMEGERLLGMLSIGDLVKATIDDQQFTIGQLERYITT